MSRDPKQKNAGIIREDADRTTRQIPLANSSTTRQPADNAGNPRISSDQQNAGVPQETVPMPIPAWPATPVVDEAPDKPPPLRRKDNVGSRPSIDSALRQPWLVQRTGVLTGELRRALPPWALPLLSSQPVSVWLGARIGLTLLAFLAGFMLPSVVAKGTANWYGTAAGPYLTPLVDRLGGAWTRWDGQWYLKIATQGYSKDDGSAAFFPLYPWILRVIGWLAGERYIWAGIVLSSLFFLAALILLHRLVRLDFHPADAGRTTFYLTIFPMAFFFWAVYSESLFLFLAVGALLAARTQRWWWATVCISFAIWTRMTGLLLLLPLAWELWRAYHPPIPTDPRAMPPARPSRWALPSLVLPAISLLGFFTWVWVKFGDPLATLKAQGAWNRSFTWPWETVVNGLKQAAQLPLQYFGDLQSWTYGTKPSQDAFSQWLQYQEKNQDWTYLGAFLFAVTMGLLSIRWLRGSYSVYLWAGIFSSLFLPTPQHPLFAYARYVIVLFPAFISLALVGRNRYAHQIILWASLLLLALFTIRFTNWFWVA